ncbi:MAG: HAD-IIIC family phosphatase [Alphaproteobacteria bacterium]|nr:HAD-IIIC family phosphatase [Alphaproteobacteria bacterium]
MPIMPAYLRQSIFTHRIRVATNSTLLLHAISQLRLKVDAEVDRVMAYFAEPREMPAAYADLKELVPHDEPALAAFIKTLTDNGFLTDKSPEEEQAAMAEKLGATYGRDPGALLDRYRRDNKEGGGAYWAAQAARGFDELASDAPRVDIALFGDCDMHMEGDFLRREAASRGVDLRVAATSVDDFAFAAERQPAALFVGALNARYFLMRDPEAGQEAHALYIEQARHILRGLRAHTVAPIFIDALPEPTVQPLGLADRGPDSHRNRFRRANLALAELAADFADIYVVDTPAILAQAGVMPMIDDWLVDFAHMGAAAWMLQRPDSEKAAVHNQMPDMEGLARLTGPDPYAREAAMARAHVDMLAGVLGWGRKKCVIVDLDNTLWPGVLAETGAPFAWDASISGLFSYIGLYVGLHEALLCLKKRGIVLACVSKNDEAVVRDLWKYPDGYPRDRLLTLDDFVTCRINWDDKPANIRSIADELGFADDAFLFIDDNPVERDRVKAFMPNVDIWGDNLFDLRHRLLTDPRLQVTQVTAESGNRTHLVKAQLGRQKVRAAMDDDNAYIASLDIKINFAALDGHDAGICARVEELFRRTTQFNATGKIFSAADLRRLAAGTASQVFTLHVADKFGDHGLVGAAVVESREITGLVLSCRVLGMGIEHQFMRHMMQALGAGAVAARIVETARNVPVRNIYRDHGFVLKDGAWLYTSGNNLSSSPV